MPLLDPHPFNVSITRSTGQVVVRVTGELDARTAPDLRNRLVDLVEGQGNLDIVLDVSELSFIDSAGLGVLVAAARALQRRSGELTLMDPTTHVAKILHTTGVNSLVTITGS
jgi:anti-sigma B factor antagonist